MNISQINLAYMPVEDRIMMRINTNDRAEIRFWLTRRVYIQLSSTLSQAQSQLSTAVHADAVNAAQLQAVQHFEQAALAAQADLTTSFAAEAASYPLGEAPVLVTKASIKKESGRIAGVFELSTNQTLTINFDSKLAAGFYKLLGEVIKTTDWSVPKPTVQQSALSFFPLAENKTLH